MTKAHGIMSASRESVGAFVLPFKQPLLCGAPGFPRQESRQNAEQRLFVWCAMKLLPSQRGLRQCKKCKRWKNIDKFTAHFTDCKKCKWYMPKPQWRDFEFGVLRADSNNYRAEKIGAQGTFTDDEWISLLEEYGHRCLACGTSKNITVDHIIPLSRGGSNAISNIQPLCFKCNLHKGTHVVDYRWRAHDPVD